MYCKTFNLSEELQWYQKTFFRINLLHCSKCPEFPFLSGYQPIPGPQTDWGLNNFKFENINSSYTRTYNCSKYSMGLYLWMSGRTHLSQAWLKTLPRLIIIMSLKLKCNTCNCLLNQYLTVCFRSLPGQVPWCLPETLGRSVLYPLSPVPKEQSQ